MSPALSITVIYSDVHLIELHVTASNGPFQAQTDVYADLDTPRAMADMLTGFPRSPNDVRMVELGSTADVNRLGGARLRFYCRDSAGHPSLEVVLRTAAYADPLDRANAATIHVEVEAAAIDTFVEQLRQMTVDRGSRAEISRTV